MLKIKECNRLSFFSIRHRRA